MPDELEHVQKVMKEAKVDTVILGDANGKVKVYENGELTNSGGIEVGAAYSTTAHVFCMIEEDSDEWECDKYEDGIVGEAEIVDGS